MIPSQYSIVVVTPVFEDSDTATLLFRDLHAQFGDSIYIVAVDDGSVEAPLSTDPLHRNQLAGDVVRLRRNVGHQRAIAVGLAYAVQNMSSQQNVVIMDSDGEDAPDGIPYLLYTLQSDSIDACVAERRRRSESLPFRLFYTLYKLLFSVMTGRIIRFGNFMALKKRAADRLVSMNELATHVGASLLASKLRVARTDVDRAKRYQGRSKMNFVGLCLHGFKAFMVFAEDVIVRVGISSATIAAGTVLGAFGALTLKVLGFSTPGWFSIALGILLLIFLQTGALALMMLMLTGLLRGGAITAPADYNAYIDSIESTETT